MLHLTLFIFASLLFLLIPFVPATLVLYRREDSTALHIGPGHGLTEKLAFHKTYTLSVNPAPALAAACSLRQRALKLLAAHEQGRVTEPHSRFFAVKSDDLFIGEKDHCTGDYIACKSITLGENSIVYGSLKSKGTIILKRGAIVSGNIVAQDIILSEDCFVAGSILAGKTLSIGARCAVGGASSVYLRATRLSVAPSASIHGFCAQKHPFEDKSEFLTHSVESSIS